MAAQVDAVAGGSKPLWARSAVEVVALLRSKQVTPLELIDAAEARIKETDHLINALPILCLDRAREHARRLMQEGHPDPAPPGYLYGLPVVVKDMTAVKGVRFTLGSRIFADRVAQENDPLVDMIEASGGIVIAKSNVPEFAAGAQTYNMVFGTTTTPWDTSRTAGGSSGGSCAALAAGQVWLATGTDLGGSQRIPAAFCGVVGIRPSVGLVPQQYNGEPAPTAESPGLHSVSGPLARTIPDLALFLDAMVGQHARDPLSKPRPAMLFSDAIKPGALPRPQRIAWSIDFGGMFPVEPEVAAVVHDAVAWFRSSGADVVEAHPDVHDIDEFHGVLRSAKFKTMSYLLEEPNRALTKPEVVWEIERALSQLDEQVDVARAAHAAYVARVVEFLGNYDLFLTPTVIMLPYKATTKWPSEFMGKNFQAYYNWQILSYIMSIAPVPAVSVPAGLASKPELPVGLQLVAGPGKDAFLLAAAAGFEAAHQFHKSLPMYPRCM